MLEYHPSNQPKQINMQPKFEKPINPNQLLARFLAADERPDGTLCYHQVLGFLFAIVCSPELIKPSEWLPLIFNEQDAGYADLDEAKAIIGGLLVLYNDINSQVLAANQRLPDDIELKEPPLDNVGEPSPLGQWSSGFFLGHDWLDELWRSYTPEPLGEELSACLMVLSFFSSRKLAEAYYAEVVKDPGKTLEAYAETMLSLFESAINSYAHLGRSIQTALEQQRPMVRIDKVGRNDPCPCGSGKKYKKCCLH
jgi:uncharacterized protein